MTSIILIDGNPLQWRAIYAKNEQFVCEGILTYFFKIVAKFESSDVLLFWDSGRSRIRSELYPKYKENRDSKKADLDMQEISNQKKDARRILSYFGVRDICVHGVEADDLIAWFAEYFTTIYDQVIIVSRDRDLWQLINDKVVVYDPFSNETITAQKVHEEFGVYPKFIPDWKALVGDTADNIPGVKGIGEKAASKYLGESNGIAGLLDLGLVEQMKKLKTSAKILDQSEDLEIFYRMVKLPTLCDMKYWLNHDEKIMLRGELAKEVRVDRLRARIELEVLGTHLSTVYVNDIKHHLDQFYSFIHGFVSASEASVSHLDTSIGNCGNCNRQSEKVLPCGYSDAKFVLLGSNFEGVEERLDQLIYELGLTRRVCWVTRVCKCSGGPLVDGEILACSSFVKNELELIKPKMVIALGNEAMWIVSGLKNGCSKNSGMVLEKPTGVIGTIDAYVAILPSIQYAVRSERGETEFQYGVGKVRQFLGLKRRKASDNE
jgi:uracil-DNA glycosylase family 4